MSMKALDAPLIHKPVVTLASARADRQRSIEERWQRFVDAQERSKRTLAIEDGIAAGKAYADFVEMFVARRA
jgi:hypothetical protein